MVTIQQLFILIHGRQQSGCWKLMVFFIIFYQKMFFTIIVVVGITWQVPPAAHFCLGMTTDKVVPIHKLNAMTNGNLLLVLTFLQLHFLQNFSRNAFQNWFAHLETFRCNKRCCHRKIDAMRYQGMAVKWTL